MIKSNKKIIPPGPGQDGSFALMLALSLTFVLLLFSFVLDLGYFTREKNRYQAAAEAAALAAADTICYATASDIDALILEIIHKFNLDLTEDNLDIDLGFYDAYDEYSYALGDYTDFASWSEGEVPEGQPLNAVMVKIGLNSMVKSLTGLGKEKKVLAAAVAYIPKISMASGGEIIFLDGTKISMANGSIYARDDIHLRGDDLAKKNNNIRITTSESGKIYNYTLKNSFWGPIWAKGGPTVSEDLPERTLAADHMTMVTDLVSRLKKRADTNFSLTQRGGEFYEYREAKQRCFFDFTRSHDRHRIIFIDLPDTCTAYLTPYPCGIPGCTNPLGSCTPCDPSDPGKGICATRAAFGNSMANMTIIATCDVIVPIYKNRDGKIITLGGEGFDRLNIISLGSIEFSTQNNELAGVNFACKEGFLMEFSHAEEYLPPLENKIRVISESGDIFFKKNNLNTQEQYDFNLSGGLQCPPVFPSVLGFLSKPE